MLIFRATLYWLPLTSVSSVSMVALMWERHISLSNSLVCSVVMATGLSFLHLSAYANSLAHSIAEQGVVCSVGVASREQGVEFESSSIPLWTILCSGEKYTNW